MAAQTRAHSFTTAGTQAPPGSAMEPSMASDPQMMRLSHPILNWRGITAAGAVSIGFVVVTSTLWNALAFSSDNTWVADNIAWLNAGTLMVAWLLAGLLAGFLGRRGLLAGFMNGVTAWGALVAIYVFLGSAAALPLTIISTTARQSVATATQAGSFWPGFLAFAGGLAAAVIGGVFGAAVPRPSRYDDEMVIDLRESTMARPQVETEERMR